MPKIIGLVSLALLLALFLGVNITADRVLSGARLDLTEGRLYTIQDATKRIARSPDDSPRWWSASTVIHAAAAIWRIVWARSSIPASLAIAFWPRS